jgi:hypothetical protein
MSIWKTVSESDGYEPTRFEIHWQTSFLFCVYMRVVRYWDYRDHEVEKDYAVISSASDVLDGCYFAHSGDHLVIESGGPY